MEEQVDFTVVLDKIIKTDELLQIHLKSANELQKLKSLNLQLKSDREKLRGENEKLKVKDETSTYNLEQLTKRNKSLDEDNAKLNKKVVSLEEELSKVVNDLEIKYQTASLELKECTEKLKRYEDNDKASLQLCESPKKRGRKKKEIVGSDKKLEAEITKLREENQDYKIEQDQLKKQLQHNEEELAKLHQVVNQQKTIKSRSSKHMGCQTEVHETITKSSQKDLYIEVEKYRRINTELRIEIKGLHKELTESKEMNSKLQKEADVMETEHFDLDLPTIAVEDFTETNTMEQQFPEDKPERDTPLDEEIQRIFHEECQPLILSPFRTKSVLRRPSIRPSTSQVPSTSGDFLVTTSLPRSRKVFKTHIRKQQKRKQPRVDLLSTLLALKNAEINFTISNESILGGNLLPPSNAQSFVPKVKRKPIQVYTEALKCGLSCKKYFMSMKKSVNGDNRLLGFFEVKDEEDTASGVKIDVPNFSKDVTIETRPLDMTDGNVESPLCQKQLTEVSKRQNSHHQENVELEEALCTIDPYEEPEISSVSRIPNSILEHLDMMKKASARRNNDMTKVNLNQSQTKEEKRPKVTSNSQINMIQEDLEVEIDVDTSFELETTSTTKTNRIQESLEMEIDVDTSFEHEKISSIPIDSNESEHLEVARKTQRILRKKNTTPLGKLRAKITKINRMRGLIDNLVSDSEELVCKKQRVTHKVENVCDKPTIGKKAVKVLPNAQETVKDVGKEPQASFVVESSEIVSKPVKLADKTVFKRPLCRTRHSPRLARRIQSDEAPDYPIENPVLKQLFENCQPLPQKCVRKPEPTSQPETYETEIEAIPEEQCEVMKVVRDKMPPSKVEVHFEKLIAFPNEEKVLNEIVEEFNGQSPEYVAEAILQRISKDHHSTPTLQHAPAPLLTEIQRIMLAFMSRLESTHTQGVYEQFLKLAECRLLTHQALEEIAPITRLYLAVCKQQRHDIHRMRKLCCDVFYFCGEMAVPFLFVVLTSWSEVLPHFAQSEQEPLARVLVQLVYMSEDNRPGFNLMPLRDLLIKFYGYPTERWDSDVLFKELLQNYMQRPVRSADFAILLLCKHHPEKWVHDKIEQCLKPLVDVIPAENFKAAIIIFIGNLSHRFSSKSQPDYLTGIREWMRQLLTVDNVPDVVKRSVYLCLKRLKKK